MHRNKIAWRWDCASCGFLASDLVPRIGDSDASIDEAERARALGPLRQRNFSRLLDRIDAKALAGQRRLLDVGCAHGWFMELARERGYEVHGIEPDKEIAEVARGKGLDVRIGFFPDDLASGERFDLVVFNDVLEHMPDPCQTLSDVRERLSEGGLLVVNLPNSRGMLYRAATMLSKVGVRDPHDRLWQVGFPSPHLSYFHPDGLARLAVSKGFREVDRGELPLFDIATLWGRLRFDRALGAPAAAVIWVALVAAYPVMRLLPSDITFQIFSG